MIKVSNEFYENILSIICQKHKLKTFSVTFYNTQMSGSIFIDEGRRANKEAWNPKEDQTSYSTFEINFIVI